MHRVRAKAELWRRRQSHLLPCHRGRKLHSRSISGVVWRTASDELVRRTMVCSGHAPLHKSLPATVRLSSRRSRLMGCRAAQCGHTRGCRQGRLQSQAHSDAVQTWVFGAARSPADKCCATAKQSTSGVTGASSAASSTRSIVHGWLFLLATIPAHLSAHLPWLAVQNLTPYLVI